YAGRDLLARYRSVREDHVRFLVKCGVLRPVLRTNADTFFAFPDVATLKQVNDDIEAGASFRAVSRSLVASKGGQLAFDFRLDASAAKIIALRPRRTERSADGPAPAATLVSGKSLAEEYFRAASLLDDGDEVKREEAAAAYRTALEFDPYLVP